MRPPSPSHEANAVRRARSALAAAAGMDSALPRSGPPDGGAMGRTADPTSEAGRRKRRASSCAVARRDGFALGIGSSMGGNEVCRTERPGGFAQAGVNLCQ